MRKKMRKKTVPHMRWELLPWAITLIFVLAILNFGTKTVVYTETESYVEHIPYTYEIPLKYEVIDYPRWISDSLQMKIKNTDNEIGTYNVSFIIESNETAERRLFNRRVILSPGRTGIVGVSESEIEIGRNITISTVVTPSAKVIQETRSETRTRIVTKVKEVTLLQYLLHLY